MTFMVERVGWAERQRLPVPARRAPPRSARRGHDGRYDDSDEVDICIVGAGAGGSVLAQRLARAGWRVVVIEAGPFWHPDEDWVSDEAGSHQLYWNQKRIIGGADPIEMGKNNSGRGVGGSMVHYAGYCPRFHPSDLQTRRLDGVGADWPIDYEDIRPHYETVERELPWPARTGLGATRTSYPFSPHPVSEAASVLWRGAHRLGHQDAGGAGRHRQRHLREPPALHLPGLLPAGLQGQRQGQPLCHPPARRPGPRGRDPGQLHGGPGGYRPGQRAGHRRHVHQGGRDHVERRSGPRSWQWRATRSRRPGCCSTPPRGASLNGLGNDEDQVGRYVMVQGATQSAGRFPDELRMYKAPPPEVSSEDFYETDPGRGFARGFSIQTVSPLPIGWAEHVLADGHWGRALREYMRDYNHWTDHRGAQRAVARTGQPSHAG